MKFSPWPIPFTKVKAEYALGAPDSPKIVIRASLYAPSIPCTS